MAWLSWARRLASASILAFATSAQAQPAPTPTIPPDAYGLYMTRAADCMPCHTRPGGTPFAGGLQINMPFGMLTSPNITPDPDTGIGGWTDDQFYAAVHDGIGHAGEYLYPVMPFPSYTRMTREDVLAIKRYLFTLKPVFAPRAPSAMDFPFNVRTSMIAWRELFFTPGAFRPDPAHSADWNRGAYLVQGAGHCGACHTPRDLLGASETAERLAGGTVDQWLAPNISSDPLSGISDRTVAQIETFLRTGATSSMGVAFGPMSEVVHDSLRYLTDADVHAIAVYLKEGPDHRELDPVNKATKVELRRGSAVYVENCAQCHQDKGQGIPGAVPNLAGNAVVEEFQPHDMIVVILEGLTGTGTYGHMPGFAGALSDQQISDVANYVRVGFGNRSVADVTPTLVDQLRFVAHVTPAGTEAARAFDCPAVGSAPVPNVLATPADVASLASGGFFDMANKIDTLIQQIRQQQPGISDATLSNLMIASYCPVVANDPVLTNSQRRARLMSFSMSLQDRIAANPLSSAERVLVSVPLRPDVLQEITQTARDQHEPLTEWMARTLARQAQ